MPVLPHEKLSDFEGKFTSFEKVFPTVDGRLRFAWQLLTEDPEYKYNVSQTQLAAHWGEDRDSLLELAFFIYALKVSVDKNQGQPFIAFSKGTLEDILSDDDTLQGDVEAEFGLVDGRKELEHGFGGNTGERNPRALKGIKPPFLVTTVQLYTPRSYELSMEAGEPDYGYVGPIGKSKVPVYDAVLPLDNANRYEALRHTDERLVVFGRDICTKVFNALERKGLEGIQDRVDFQLAA